MIAELGRATVIAQQPHGERHTWRAAGLLLLLMAGWRALMLALTLDPAAFTLSVVRSVGFDLILGIGLLAGWKNAHRWVVWRVLLGGLAYIFWALPQHEYTALVAQLAVSSGLLLCLLGPPQRKRTMCGVALCALGFASVVGTCVATGLVDGGASSSSTADRLLERGYEALHREDYPAAVEAFDRALSQQPDSALAFNGLGWAHDSLEEYAEALDDYGRALELEPDNAAFYVNRALTLSNLGRLDEAISDYDRAIELDNADWELYLSRGGLHLELGAYNRARQDFETALQNAPDDEAAGSVQEWLDLLERQTPGLRA